MGFTNLVGFLNFLKPTQQNKDKAQAEFENITKTFWDATNGLNLSRIKTNSLEIFSKYEKLKQDPKIISRQKRNGLIIGILGTIVSLALTPIMLMGADGDGFQLILFGIIISWAYYGGVVSYYKNLAIDLVKAQIAKENHWLYDPEHDGAKWRQLSQYFPEIFQKGNKSQYVEDQFWGVFDKNSKQTHFNTGRFSYTIESGSGKNRSSKTYHNHYFIFAIPKNLKSRFHLYPENFGNRISNFFSKKEINTESIEFNKTFAFSYDGQKGDKALHIVKTLSPAIQEKLINLAKEKKDTQILFAHNTITFCFQGYMLTKPKTDFQKELKLAPEDKKIIEDQMDFLIEISTEMSRFLD
jgi:hypothetical protein